MGNKTRIIVEKEGKRIVLEQDMNQSEVPDWFKKIIKGEEIDATTLSEDN